MGLWKNTRRSLGFKSAPAPEESMITLKGNIDEILQQIANGGETGLGLSKNYRAQLMEGYAANPYVAKCIDLRASAVSSLEPIIFDHDDNEITDHPLRRLFHRPNPSYSWSDMIYEVASDMAMNGNAYFEPIKTINGLTELWYMRAGDVQPIPQCNRYFPVKEWLVTSHGQVAHMDPDRLIHIVGGKKDPEEILAISPLSSARLSIIQQTEARTWNVSLMRNGAKPSVAILSPKRMTDSEYSTFSKRLNAKHAGTQNAGSTMVLDDGKTISTAGFNARDMDYAVGVTTSAREISVALGVPPELVGDSANKTYSNAQEANKEFALQTVVPDAKRIYDALTWYVAPIYPEVARIGYDMTQIEALRGNEVELMNALQAVEYLTPNEKRARLAYDRVKGGDVILASMGKVPLSELATPIEDLVPTYEPDTE